jgi:hypothetical protein
MNVTVLPISRQRQHDVQAALSSTDETLFELLRQAVVACSAGGLRIVGSLGHRHHLELANAYLHSVEIFVRNPGVQTVLSRHLASGVHDIRFLAGVARDWVPDGPRAA